MIAFGPVPSRRLGSSLGINHIPPKYCSYSCIYCQARRTTNLTFTRQQFFRLEEIIHEVKQKIDLCQKSHQAINYLTLVPDGEPTLDANLGNIIDQLHQFQIPIAVISNASLIDRPDVQAELARADWVSIKIDTVREPEFQKINRPYRRISLSSILESILRFRQLYNGYLATETMLVSGMNDSIPSLQELSLFLQQLDANCSYLAIPTRPPAESWVQPPQNSKLQEIIKLFSDKPIRVNFLFDLLPEDIPLTGDLKENILSLSAVHPLKEEDLRLLVEKSGGDWTIIEELLKSQELICIHYRQQSFYLRNYPKTSTSL